MAKYQVEITDTFAGEANYSWVRRFTIEGSTGTGHKDMRKLARDAKKSAGWSGLRCSTDDYGDSLTLRPVGRSAPCWIMFVTYLDPQPEEMTTEQYEATFNA